LLIALFVIVFGWIYALKVESVRLKYDYVKIKMPAVGKLIVKIYEGRFARTLSSLYSSGIPMIDCLERSSRILGNSYVDKMFIQVIDDGKCSFSNDTFVELPFQGSNPFTLSLYIL
jgi:type IV pilus assembly protein PilC